MCVCRAICYFYELMASANRLHGDAQPGVGDCHPPIHSPARCRVVPALRCAALHGPPTLINLLRVSDSILLVLPTGDPGGILIEHMAVSYQFRGTGKPGNWGSTYYMPSIERGTDIVLFVPQFQKAPVKWQDVAFLATSASLEKPFQAETCANIARPGQPVSIVSSSG